MFARWSVQPSQALACSSRALLIEGFLAWAQNTPDVFPNLREKDPITIELHEGVLLHQPFTEKPEGLRGFVGVDISVPPEEMAWSIVLPAGREFQVAYDCFDWIASLPHELAHIDYFYRRYGGERLGQKRWTDLQWIMRQPHGLGEEWAIEEEGKEITRRFWSQSDLERAWTQFKHPLG